MLSLASSILVLGLERICPRKVGPWPQICLCPWPRTLGPRLHLWQQNAKLGVNNCNLHCHFERTIFLFIPVTYKNVSYARKNPETPKWKKYFHTLVHFDWQIQTNWNKNFSPPKLCCSTQTYLWNKFCMRYPIMLYDTNVNCKSR